MTYKPHQRCARDVVDCAEAVDSGLVSGQCCTQLSHGVCTSMHIDCTCSVSFHQPLASESTMIYERLAMTGDTCKQPVEQCNHSRSYS